MNVCASWAVAPWHCHAVHVTCLCLGKSCLFRAMCLLQFLAGRSKKLKNVNTHALVDSDCKTWTSAAQLPVSASWQEGWSLMRPWVLSNASDCFEAEGVQKTLKGFTALFKDSSMRVTEGRAQAPVNPEASADVQTAIMKLIPAAEDGSPLILSLPTEKQKEFPQLHKSMGCASFGIAASHVSLGKFELQLMPCARAAFQGTRFVTVILLRGVLKRLKVQASSSQDDSLSTQRAQEYLFKCSESDIESLSADGAAFCPTIGPNDLLFLPGGCMVSHRVHSRDVVGVRVGVLAPGMMPDLREILQLGDTALGTLTKVTPGQKPKPVRKLLLLRLQRRLKPRWKPARKLPLKRKRTLRPARKLLLKRKPQLKPVENAKAEAETREKAAAAAEAAAQAQADARLVRKLLKRKRLTPVRKLLLKRKQTLRRVRKLLLKRKQTLRPGRKLLLKRQAAAEAREKAAAQEKAEAEAREKAATEEKSQGESCCSKGQR